jgi:diguanylate cyclase (GGDEF)-like protein/PAS domain S-box-containing protein
MNMSFYRQAVAESSVGYAYHKIIYDKNGVPFDYEFVEVNAAFEALTGLLSSEIVGKMATEVLSDVDKREIGWIERLRDTAINNGEKEFEHYLRTVKKWINVKVYSQVGNYFITQLTDITGDKWKSTELENLKVERESLSTVTETLFNTVPSAVFSADNKCNITGWNKRAENITGYSADEMLGQDCSAFMLERCNTTCGLISERAEKSIIGKLHKIKTKQGDILTILKSANFLKNVDGSANGSIECFEDITDRIRLEQHMREIEEKYRLFFELTPLGILHFDKKGCITDCNENFIKIIGASMNTLIGVDILELPDEKLTAAMKQALLGQIGIYEGVYQSHHADKVTPVRVIFTPIKSDDETVMGGIGIVEDITERKQAEDAILQSAATWKAIITSSPDGIALISLDGKLQFVSEKLVAMHGYSADVQEKLVGRWIIDFIDTSYHGLLTDNICKLLAGKEINHLTEYQAIKKDGSRFFIEVTSTALKDSRGKPINILIIERDITKRKEAEEALRISEEKYIAIFDESPIAIELYDSEGGLTHVNGAWTELFGIRNINDISSLNLFDDPTISKDIKTDLLENKHVRYETVFNFDLVKSNNLYRTTCLGSINLDITIKPMLYDKKINGYIVQRLDITEQKKAQGEIEYLSYHDKLTGLYNRRFYEEEFVRLDVKRNLPLTIVIADVNGLKLINDSFGHTLGDELIKKTAEILTMGCRGDEIIARLGGDEFVILLPQTDSFEAENLINRIKQLASKEQIGSIDISIAFGYGTKRNVTENLQEIFKNAEDYMYTNKICESTSVKNKMIDLIMNALYKKSSREKLHSKGVSEICEMIATKMALGQDMVNQIKIAGLMHDIGIMGIDGKITNNYHKLSHDECVEMKRHPEIGYRILISSNEFSGIAGYVLEHHERWDGNGYPKGLKGEEISLQARIIAVADAYDAMTSERTYQERISEEKAIVEIRRCSGTQFDPDIANLFIEMLLEKSKQ